MSFTVDVNDREIVNIFKTFPKVANSEMNRGYRRVISRFASGVVLPTVRAHYRLGPASKAVKVGNTKRAQPAIPKTLKRSGFRATLARLSSLDGKTAVVYSGSPLHMIREEGGTIRPKKGKYLIIRDQRSFAGKTKRASRARSRWAAKGSGYQHPVIARLRRVDQPPVYGLESKWASFESQASGLLEGALARIVERAERILDRGHTIR